MTDEYHADGNRNLIVWFSLGDRQIYLDHGTEGQILQTKIHSCEADDGKPIIQTLTFIWNAHGQEQRAVSRSSDKLTLFVYVKSLEVFQQISAIPAGVIVRSEAYIWEPKLLCFHLDMPQRQTATGLKRLLGTSG